MPQIEPVDTTTRSILSKCACSNRTHKNESKRAMTLEVVVWFTFADHVLVYDSANFYRLRYCAKFVICNNKNTITLHMYFHVFRILFTIIHIKNDSWNVMDCVYIFILLWNVRMQLNCYNLIKKVVALFRCKIFYASYTN